MRVFSVSVVRAGKLQVRGAGARPRRELENRTRADDAVRVKSPLGAEPLSQREVRAYALHKVTRTGPAPRGVGTAIGQEVTGSISAATTRAITWIVLRTHCASFGGEYECR